MPSKMAVRLIVPAFTIRRAIGKHRRPYEYPQTDNLSCCEWDGRKLCYVAATPSGIACQEDLADSVEERRT